MADEGFKRKLAAILSADAVGYSRLMRDSEEDTVRDIARIMMTAVYSMAGRVEDARAEVPEVLRINPKFSLA